MIITLTVDGKDVDIETAYVTGLRRDSESSTTLMIDDGSMIHATAPFDYVHDMLIEADATNWEEEDK